MTDAAHTDSHGHHEGHDIGFHAPHAVPASLFLKVLVSLLVLTIVTVAVSRVDFGSLNMFIAMAIATVKATLVMMFFMHLKWDTASNNLAIISSFLFLSLLFIFTLADYATRGDTDPLLSESPGNIEALKNARNATMHGGLATDDH